MKTETIIVGAGLAGLSCAVELNKRGRSFKILEAGPEIGGRVATDVVEGFRLDRGFQVFLTAYPEAQRILDYAELRFKKFKAGALIRFGGEFCRVSDVIKHPGDLPGNLFSKAASISDKLKIASLRSEVGKQSLSQIAEAENISTLERLKQFGFSDRVIQSFFRPFFGGVFLEPDLATSRRMFDFVFKMFAEGDAVIPQQGMAEIARQLAEKLPEDAVELNCSVSQWSKNSVQISDGRSLNGDAVVIAADVASAQAHQTDGKRGCCSVTCAYYTADRSPINEPILVLNGDPNDGPINNLCCLTDVSAEYGPPGKSLISVTVLGSEHGSQLKEKIERQLLRWYGSEVGDWKHLKTYEIQNALPSQRCNDLATVDKSICGDDGVYYCGDYQSFASIQGAMASGRRVAEAITN